ncbi:hypothetical protein BGX38DRAFT_1201619 [Terfezia claveryi]|nr:hypothetical protein BGX38DRAFT_1201619 [Terfezia claveryi]
MDPDDPIASPPRIRFNGKAITVVPICALPPTSTDLSTSPTFISGIIALLFPYSSTTQTLRLVLAEEDPRRRADKGQLRISFHGRAAREVASRELQIGDKLILGLERGGWFKLKNVKEGRELGWSLKFEGGVTGWVRGEEVKVEGGEEKPKVLEDADEGQSDTGVSPAGSGISGGSQREWKLPTGSMGRRMEYTPAREDARELFDDEELLREMEREEREKAGVEPVRKRPRFSMGRYRVIRGNEEDLPSSESNKGSSVAGDSQWEGSVEALSEHDKIDETPVSRVDIPSPSLPTVSITDSDQQQLHQSQEPPDSPKIKPCGRTLVSPEHGELNFSDYRETSTPAKPDVDFSGSKGHLVHEERLGTSMTEPEAVVSGSQSSGYDSTGNRSRGRSPAVQPSPLRNVQTVGSELPRGMVMQGEQEDGRVKAPSLLPGEAMVEYNDADWEEDTAQGDGEKQGEEDNLLSVPRSTTRVLDDLLTHDTTQSTTQTQSDNMSQSAAFGGFQSGLTTVLSDFPPLSHLTWGHIQDFIGVVCRTKPIERAKRGQRDYFMSMRVVDSSRPLGITVSVFRPRKDALPKVEVGDCVLLRNFKIISQERNLMAISTDTCAYAVWKEFGREKVAVVNGPPVEWGVEEEEYIRRIGRWFQGLDDEVRKDLERWPGKKGKEKAVRRADGVSGKERTGKTGHGETTAIS